MDFHYLLDLFQFLENLQLHILLKNSIYIANNYFRLSNNLNLTCYHMKLFLKIQIFN